MNEETAKLFVAVDPNIGKLADEQEKIVNEVNEMDKPEEQKLENLKSTEEEVFTEPKPKRGRKKKEGLRPLTTPDVPVLKPVEEASYGGKTPPVEEATEPAPAPEKEKTVKQLEMEERRRLKEAEAKAKAIAKEQKRLDGIERNRERARERHRKLAAEKKKKKEEEEKEIRKQIVKDTKVIDRLPSKNNDFTFDKFANYMMQYENLKMQYAEQQQRKKQMEEKPKPKPQPQYNPEHYPLAGLYDPRNRYKNNFPTDNFY